MKADIDSWRRPLFDDVIRRIRVRSGEYYRPEFGTSWGVSVSRNCPVFHVVRCGTCRLELRGAEPIHLSEGDCAIVVRGDHHVVRTGPSASVVNFFDLLKTREHVTASPVRFGGPRVTTSMLCGGASFETTVNNPLRTILPPVIHVKPYHWNGNDSLDLTIQHISTELDRGASGSPEVLNRLTDVLFIRAVNAYFDQNMETAESGWLAAVRDEPIGRALLMFHKQPHDAWRIDMVARRLALSRSSFAARFRELVGEPPLQYLTRLRMNTAAMRLRTSNDKLRSVASAVGYSSVTAFVKAFQRSTGVTPGEYRQRNAR